MVSKLNANRQPGEAFGAATGRIYKDIGFGGLWNGLVIRIFMIGTLTSLRKSSINLAYFRILLTPYQNGVSTTASRSSWVFQPQEALLHLQSRLRISRNVDKRQKAKETGLSAFPQKLWYKLFVTPWESLS